MSFGRILWCVLAISSMAIAQSPEALKYAQRPILLMGTNSTEEGVMPMVLTTDGVQHLEFVPISRIKEFAEHGGQPVRLADVLATMGKEVEMINQLQAENEKLWKVAMKDNPQQPQPTVVVQQPVQRGPSPLEKYILLRSLFPTPQPYQLPMPVNPNANRLKTNCTAQTVGNTTYTDCH